MGAPVGRSGKGRGFTNMSTDLTTTSGGDDEATEAAALAVMSDAELREMSNLEGGTFVDLWTKITEKEKLIGREFAILRVKFNDKGEYDQPYVTVWGKVLGPKGYCFVFSDGSTGVNKQLRSMAAANKGVLVLPIICPQGLRVSKYSKKIDGKDTPAETFYIDGAQG